MINECQCKFVQLSKVYNIDRLIDQQIKQQILKNIKKNSMQQPKDKSQKKRKQLTSEDLKRRLYQKGIHGNSMPSLKSPLVSDKSPVLYVNLNSSMNKREQNQSPKILKKTASAFGKAQLNSKSFLPSIAAQQFQQRKKSPFNRLESSNTGISKTAIKFYTHKRTDSEPQEEVVFNSSFYKNDSVLRENETKMTKRLVEKMSGHGKKEEIGREKSRFLPDGDEANSPRQKRDQIVEKQGPQAIQDPTQTQPYPLASLQSYSLQQYISLISKNIPNIDQFLYLVRQFSSTPDSDNIYQLQIIDYQQIKAKDKETGFEYYTISKKGFCHYLGGKPVEFIELKDWLEEKATYQNIKRLNFFSRFRRWKTIKMWIKKVVRHRIQKCSSSLEQRLFILNPTVRACVLEINSINLEMQKNLAIISRNQGTYTLQSFRHCQQKNRRQAASILEEFSRRSRQSVRKCFEQSFENLKQILRTKNSNEDKNFAATSHNPKDNAFQVLGFPAKMSYEHRSKLRKLTGRFVRFSYLVDFIHLNGLAGSFKSQIESLIGKLNTLQVQSQVQAHYSHTSSKQSEDTHKWKIFNIQAIFGPSEISEYNLAQVPMEVFDISMKIQRAGEIFNPLYHIRQKSSQQQGSNKLIIKQQLLRVPSRKYVENICELWVSLKPTLDNVFDEVSFLIKESMSSLKYFQRWSKHREMQKYVNILEEWDDIVSQNWQVSQSDNLDPISIIQNLQSYMSRIKQMIQTSQNKLTEKIIDFTTQPLNIYWENTQADVDQLITNPNIQNNAQTIEFYLAYMTQNTQKFQLKIPNSIDLGIFSLSLDKIKHQIIDYMKNLCERFKQKIPTYVEEHTNSLNTWLNEKSTRLRQQIHNIDDFVRLNKSLKEIQTQFFHKKDLCNDLGHIYQTMYIHRIQSKRRKQFQVQTLKAKDQLQQLMISVEQTIERKTQFYTKQVSRQHIPKLIKQIQKINDNFVSEEFQSLKSSAAEVIRKLLDIKNQYSTLKLKKTKCLEYLSVLKLSQIQISQLDELQKQINARLTMWQSMCEFDSYIQKINVQLVNELDLQSVKNYVTEKRSIVKQTQSIHNKPNNEVLQLLKQMVETYFVNVPLLQGFNERLSESHWQQISEIVKEYPYLDLRKKEFTLKKFLQTDIGKQAKRIQFIFSKAKVQNQLQVLYSEVENAWLNTVVKSRVESKFIIVSNAEGMREAFDYMMRTLSTILANPFSATLKQYSITYELLGMYYNTFQNWMSIQQRLLKLDSQCKLLDVKKLSDYSQFQNCQKIYKNVMKLFSNRNVDNGVKMAKLFVNGLDEKLIEMDECLKKVEDNIRLLLEDHRKNYPPFYLFDDEKLFKIITQPTNPSVIEQIATTLLPCIQKLQFEGERITGIINFDQQKYIRNPISTTFDLEQILLFLSEANDNFLRKNMRQCRYKAVESNLIKLLPHYQTQYLLAINKVDFTNYTQISIDNQSQAPDSLKQFCKVMKKDITEDLKLRPSLKPHLLPRYDTLILQTLYHEHTLNSLIKLSVSKTTDFEWQNTLKFYWDQNNNNDDNNILVKHCHAKRKYGNEYVGSRAKVVVEADINLLWAVDHSETAVFAGAQYALERLMHFVGHRLAVFDCSAYSTLKSVNNFVVGHWYSETACLLKNFDRLNQHILHSLVEGTQLKLIKESLLKKSVFNAKENQKKQNAIFLSVSHQSKFHDFRGKCRVVHHLPATLDHVKNMLKIKGIFDNEIGEFLLKIFEMINYLEEKSQSFNISLEHFLETKLDKTQSMSKLQLFEQLMSYIKPKMGLDNLSIIEETVKFYLSSESTMEEAKDEIIQTAGTHSKTVQKAKQKQKSGSKKSLRSIQTKFSQSKSHDKVAKPTKQKTQQPMVQDEGEDKERMIREALSERGVVILTGAGRSKLHCVKKLYQQSHKIVEVFSEVSLDTDCQGLITQMVMREKGDKVLFYFDGMTLQMLQQLQQIMQNSQLGQVKKSQLGQVKKRITENNVLLAIGVQNLAHFTYSSVSQFFWINIEQKNEHLIQRAREWSQQHLQTQKQKQSLIKFVSQTLLATFQNWSIKDPKVKQKHIFVFLTQLQSLLPVSKLVQAMVYSFVRVFANLDTDCVKLEFLVKKIVGEDRLGEDEKVGELIYCTLGQEEGLYHARKLHGHYLETAGGSLRDSPLQLDHVITPQLYHHCTIMQRVLSKTPAGVYLVGPPSSGKSSLYAIYKHLHFPNQSFLRLTMRDHSHKQNFTSRLFNNFDLFSLNQLHSKINYQSALLIVDDISMPDINELSHTQLATFNYKITLLKQLIHYKILQYPSFYPSRATKNAFQSKIFTLSHASFILSGHDHFEQFKDCTIPLQLNLHEPDLKSIFNQYLRQRLPYLEISDLMLSDMVSTTMEICKKIGARNVEFEGLELATVKSILSKFIMLKTKQTTTAISKQVERYWVYLLYEHLAIYDTARRTDHSQHAIKQQLGESVIRKQLKGLNLDEHKQQHLCYTFLHTTNASSGQGCGKKVEFVKDMKRLFNSINERIQKYNESQNRRYGQQFDYIHFDELVRKIVKLGNNLPARDYLLYGRKGTGKQALIKLISYIQGSNYKPVPSSGLRASVTDIFANTNITTMSSYVVCKHLTCLRDVEDLKEFYYTDFQNQLLNSKELDKPIKIYLKDKQKQQKQLSTTGTMKAQQKTYGSLTFSSPEYYIAPRSKPSHSDCILYRSAIRIVLLTNDRSLIRAIPTNIKTELMVDEMDDIPIASVQEYNVKFLDAEEVKYSPKSSKLLAEIWTYSKVGLEISLKAYDDAIRLFSSFMSTLYDQIKEELHKYAKIIELYNQLRKLNQALESQVEDLHQKVRALNELILIEETQDRINEKIQIQTALQKKSTCFSKGQKILEFLTILIPFFKQKDSLIQKYVLDKDYFEESLVVASCYFTFLSEFSFPERRAVLSQWYNNDKIPSLVSSQPITSFLTLFNLYKEEFNAEPNDDLEDFYENMAIVFNSVKPVLIRDKARRGRQWLDDVCKFVVISQRQGNFVDVICENLGKISNILIEITNQQTMNNISSSFINTLLYLGDNTETINIKGQELKVNPQAKFYVLLGESVAVPPELKDDFTVVSYSESQPMLEKSLQYSYMAACHPKSFYSGLEASKRLRAHRLERQALMLQIAQIIYASFQSDKESTSLREDQSSKSALLDKQPKPESLPILQKSKQQLEQCLNDITDKTMTRSQALANRLIERQEFFKEFEFKQSTTGKFDKETQDFILECKNLMTILHFMSRQSQILHKDEYFYSRITHQELVKKISIGLRRGFIHAQNRASLYLFAIKIWGPQFVQNDYWVFLMAIFQFVDQIPEVKKDTQRKNLKLCEDKKDQSEKGQEKEKPTILNIESYKMLKQCESFDHFKWQMQERLQELLGQFAYQKLIPYMQFSGTIMNMEEGDDRRIILNNVWSSGKESKFYIKLQQNLKLVRFEIKDPSNVEGEIKKNIFEQNVLLIESVQLLEQTLEHLQKLASHQKTIYFKCQITPRNIQKINFFSKRYNVTQLNHIYQNKNDLLAECLQNLHTQRQLNRVSSATNIKSTKSIANIDSNKRIVEKQKNDDDKRIVEKQKNADDKRIVEKYDYEKKTKDEPTTAKPTTQNIKQKTFHNDEVGSSVKITKNTNTQKMITALQLHEEQEMQNSLEQISNKVYSLLKIVYESSNLFVPFTSENEPMELSEYVTSCNTSEEQEFELQARVKLMLKILQAFKAEPYSAINTQIAKKVNELRSMFDSVVKSSPDQMQQAHQYLKKLQQLLTHHSQTAQNSLAEAAKKANKVHFQTFYLSYFKLFFPTPPKSPTNDNDHFDLPNILKQAAKILDSIQNINDQPVAVKRNSRKSINVIFKKEDLKQKISGPVMTSSPSNLTKKAALKRFSKQSIQTIMNRKQSDLPPAQDSDLCPLLLQIEYKKLCSKTSSLTDKIQQAIQNCQESESIELLLLLLQDEIPGTWILHMDHPTFTVNLSGLFKKYIRFQEDMSFNLDKVKRSKHAEIDFNFLKYSKDYIQLHFRKKISYFDPTVFMLANNPTPQDLQSSEDYIKIASIQSAGWRFSNEPNVIDFVTGGDKPMVSEGKIPASCYFIQKDAGQMINLVPIDVYESRASLRPIMKVHGNCKKQTLPNSANGLSLYLKESTDTHQ